MLALAVKLEQICRVTGRVVAWLCLSMVIVTGIVVIERYAFDSGSIRLQESITFMHAVLFMLTAAYTLAAGDHVRVDVFYGSMSARGRALVDLCGSVLLLFPFCLFIAWTSWDFVSVSWAIREASQEAGGLPYPFVPLMKSCIPLAMTLLLLQGLSMLLTSIATLTGPHESST